MWLVRLKGSEAMDVEQNWTHLDAMVDEKNETDEDQIMDQEQQEILEGRARPRNIILITITI